MKYIKQNEIIDFILHSYKEDLGIDFELYHNHVYRVFNYAIANITSDLDHRKIAIAVAFHDLGIWTNNTFDYINPSKALAKKYCVIHSIDDASIVDIERMIDDHHKLTKITDNELSEVFRQADLTDLSWGLIHRSMKQTDIRKIKQLFPNKGFHRNLCGLFFKNLFINPLRPLPMFKR